MEMSSVAAVVAILFILRSAWFVEIVSNLSILFVYVGIISKALVKKRHPSRQSRSVASTTGMGTADTNADGAARPEANGKPGS